VALLEAIVYRSLRRSMADVRLLFFHAGRSSASANSSSPAARIVPLVFFRKLGDCNDPFLGLGHHQAYTLCICGR